MKKILTKIGIALAVIGVLTGVGAGFASATTNGGHGGGNAEVSAFPSGTSVYYDYDKGYGVVVATSGINVSKTASFTINGAPYDGANFYPGVNVPGDNAKNTAAFAGYLDTPDWVYGPGAGSFVPAGYPNIAPPASTAGLKLLWSGKTGYTNNVETYVYEGTGLNNGVAAIVAAQLKG